MVGDSSVVASKANTEARVTSVVNVNQGEEIAGVNNVQGIFASGLSDSLSSLASGGSSTAKLNTITGDDGDVAITVSDSAFESSSATLTAADLSAVGGATTGTVTVTNAIKISGNTTQLTNTLVSSSSSVTASSALVTVSDAAFTTSSATIAATTLSDIGGKTSGTVTVTKAVKITGATADLTNLSLIHI